MIDWKSIAGRLAETVSEQQYTLASLGWRNDTQCPCCDHKHKHMDFSVAGARKHQYEAVEQALLDWKNAQEGDATDNTIRHLLLLKSIAVKACQVGHSDDCNCYCCLVIGVANGDEAKIAKAIAANKQGGERE